jgi:hypothetical protein
MLKFNKLAVLAAGAAMLVGQAGPSLAQAPSFNDTARVLAGLPPAAGSPLQWVTQRPHWRQHAQWFDREWSGLEKRQLAKIRAWSEKNLADRRGTLFYAFSGPDFLYASAFFPNSSTYVMSGLEPVGRVPQISDATLRALPRIRSSVATSLRLSFFITQHMREQLNGGDLSGTLPILYVFAARAGKTIDDVQLIGLDKDGVVHTAGKGGPRNAVPGVKMVLSGGGSPQTLYYFQTDVSDGGVRSSGFLRFSERLGTGDGLIKSASYLMHKKNFSNVRDFVLRQSKFIVQDDSGIPIGAFKSSEWQIRPFGKYLGPIDIFSYHYQAQLQQIYRSGNPPPLDFGIGYRWRAFDSNLILAVKKDTPVVKEVTPTVAPAVVAKRPRHVTPRVTPAALARPSQVRRRPSPRPPRAPESFRRQPCPDTWLACLLTRS